MKTLVDWMNEGKREGNQFGGHQSCRGLVMKDGTTMSVQASSFHYCDPRVTCEYSEYSSFEIGFPSREIPCLMPYAEDEHNPTDTVYGWVPKEVIEQAIAECGGVDQLMVDPE